MIQGIRRVLRTDAGQIVAPVCPADAILNRAAALPKSQGTGWRDGAGALVSRVRRLGVSRRLVAALALVGVTGAVATTTQTPHWKQRLGALAGIMGMTGAFVFMAPSLTPVPSPTYLVRSSGQGPLSAAMIRLLHDRGVRDLSPTVGAAAAVPENSVVVFDGCPQTLGVPAAMMQRLFVAQVILVGYHCPSGEFTQSIGNTFLVTFNSSVLGQVPESFIQTHVQSLGAREVQNDSAAPSGYSVLAGETVHTGITVNSPEGLARGWWSSGGTTFAEMVNDVLMHPGSVRGVIR